MKNTIQKIVMFSAALNFFLMQAQSKVVGNGKVTTKTITTENYDAIRLIGSPSVHLQKGQEGSIKVAAEDNLHAYFVVEVKGKTLIVRWKQGVSVQTKKEVHVWVPFESISKIYLEGSGDIDSKDDIIAEHLKVAATGSGDINLRVQSTKVSVRLVGSGDITLAGSTAKLQVNVRGSGDFKGYDLDAKDTKVSVMGSGDAKVVAKEKIRARVTGSGDIKYKGNPAKEKINVMGSGDISKY